MARYGLVVGVAKYKSPLGNLTKTEGDAKAVQDLLDRYGDFTNIQLLTGEVTAQQLENALARLLREQADRNEVLIYYTGHAVVVRGSFGQKRGYFALSDTTLKTSNGEITEINRGIALDELSRLMGEANLSNLIVLLDCCHSEALLEESQGFLQRAIVTQAFAGLKSDYFLVSACRKFEEAYAMRSESHSIFTGAVLQGLAEERKNDRGVVDASSMFGYVAEQLRGTGQEAVSFGYGRVLRVVSYGARGAQKVVEDVCPYVGLNAFDESTAHWFFGRDEALRRLQQKLSQSSFVFVVGVSGSGKSSLVRAKLMPEYSNEKGYQVFAIKPRRNPLEQLKLVFTEKLNEADLDVIEAVENHIDEGDLLAAVKKITQKQVLLVIDQFEEVFTLCAQKQERSKFLKMLALVAERSTADLAIVATMRADFMGECSDANLDKIINEQMVWLSPMTKAEFTEAIAKPADVQHYDLGEGLLEAILSEIEAEPNCLPLLEFALQQLWEHRDRKQHKLTADAYYHTLKGIKGALNRHAEALYLGQSEIKQKWIRLILLKLVRTGRDVKDTRQPTERQALLALGKDDQEKKEIATVLQALEGTTGRLLTAYEENGLAMVDLAHEALMEGWERFATWRKEDRDLRRLVDRISDDFKGWQNTLKNDKFLLSEGVVAQIEEVETDLPNYLTTPELQEFVRRSQIKYKPWLDPANLPEMVDIPGGTFWMGSPEGKGDDDEKPRHKVTIPAFRMGKYPITQAQWRVVAMLPKVKIDLSLSPSYHRGENNPVEQITWHEAQEFCARLSKLTGQIYRLPTEAEWEYACRARAKEYTEYCFGDDPSQLDDYAWYGNNSGDRPIDAAKLYEEVEKDANRYFQRLRENRNSTHPVGQKLPNAWGLYDMHGGVWEWCADVWHGNYETKPQRLRDNGSEPWQEVDENDNDNRYCVLRGGSWINYPSNCRGAYRLRNVADDRDFDIGFRVVVSVAPPL